MTQEPKIFPYIERLLQGAEVVWKPLGEVAELKRGTTITKKTSNEGIYPVISGGQQPAYYIDQFNRDGETITVAGSGAYAGFVMYWNEPIFVGDAFSVKADEKQVLPRFIYHFLLSIQEKIYDLKSGGGVPHVYAKDVARFVIPLPPLSVQQEIVRILDKFTQLEAELEAELDCRKRQYEYYRNKLLTFNEIGGGTEIVWKTLGEVCINIFSGKNKDRNDNASYPIYGSTGIIGKTNKKAFSSKQILVARVGANAGYVHIAEGEYDVSDNALIIQHNENINLKFLYYILVNIKLNQYAKGGGQPLITARELKSIIIPLPPLEEQQRIATILDKFNTLVNSISEGLPKEIALRRKQYEYYRERLLTFTNNNNYGENT